MGYIEELPEKWQTEWQNQGFTTPSLIQEKSYHSLLQGENLMGISPTGTGKTLAYLLPLLQRLKIGEGLQLLVLVPSQELAVQVSEVAKPYAELLDLQVQLLIGGANKKRQIEKLRQKPEVIVGTVGRIRELMIEKKIKMHLVQTLVLDEVDQMLSTRQNNQLLLEVLQRLPREIQKVAFSATGINAVPSLKENLDWQLPVVDVTGEDTSKGKVTHLYLVTEARKRGEILRRLGHVANFSGIVFFNQLADMGAMEEKLVYEGIIAQSLASDQTKIERKLAIQGMNQKKIQLLLTTDVAARGLDFADLAYIVHYDVPLTEESYLHRSGRVGRMGKAGVVITLVAPHQVAALKKLTKEPLEECHLFEGEIVLGAPLEKEKMAKPKISKAKTSKKKSSKGKTSLSKKSKAKKSKKN